MRKSDFSYELPDRLIAQTPLPERGASRLLHVDGRSGRLDDLLFAHLPALLKPNDLLVLNDTRVMPARLDGHKSSGGRIEILIERLLDERRALAHVRASKTPRPGGEILLDRGYRCRVLGREDDLFRVEFETETGSIADMLAEIGHMPLPPYIERADDRDDRERYQTVYARRLGAVAAPTAGLHFDVGMLERLDAIGVKTAYLTLHVGSGTFQPLRVENLDEHIMHGEYCEIDATVVEQIVARAGAGRSCDCRGHHGSACAGNGFLVGQDLALSGETRLFIRPGFQFNCVDAMVTNFHLPQSTLLTLVCAFAGFERVMAAYRHAVQREYRFFSYGDAMFLNRAPR